MRPLIAAVAATAALSLHPASAAAPGAGTVATYASGFFRPNIGIVAAGNCTYAGISLQGNAASVSVVPGNEESLTITCTLRNASGSTIVTAHGSGVNTARAVQTIIGGQVPTTICIEIVATSRAAGVPTATGSQCLPVLPGNVVVS
jgi:hypothetical protein